MTIRLRHLLALAGALVLGCALGAGWRGQRPEHAVAASVEDAVPAPLARARRIVDRIGAGRAHVVDVFAGPDGLAGVVVEAERSRFVGYLTPHADNLIVGALFDADGRNVSQAEVQSHGGPSRALPMPNAAPPQAAPLTGAQIERALARSASIVEGDAGPIVSAFIDLNCTFCAQLYDLSRAPVGRGHLRMRWIPVAVLAPDSLGRAAALLQAPDPVRALAEAHARQLVAEAPTAAVGEAIAGNNALLSALTSGRPVTPVLLVRRSDGAFAAQDGVPEDLMAFVTAADGAGQAGL